MKQVWIDSYRFIYVCKRCETPVAAHGSASKCACGYDFWEGK